MSQEKIIKILKQNRGRFLTTTQKKDCHIKLDKKEEKDGRNR